MDDIYPNPASTVFLPEEPKDQVQKRNEELSKIAAALPLIEDIIAHFDDRIAFYDTQKSIPEEVRLKPNEFMHAMNGNKIAMDNLIQEKEWLVSLKNSL